MKKAHKPEVAAFIQVIGHRIRAARTLKGWSQQQLAARAGITREWLGKIEKGHPTTLDILLSLSLCLEVKPRAFFSELEATSPGDLEGAIRFMSRFL